MKVEIDWERAEEVARVIGRVVGSLPIDDFTDPNYYPPPDSDRETVVRYFLVMVAMDHRLSRPGRPYEAVVGGRLFHGADLLYKLGVVKLREDPEFFSPERLSRLTERELSEWLSAGSASPPDRHVRLKLLRDLGGKLMALYGGSAYSIIVESGFMLRRGAGEGFIDRLKVFTAYQDPVEKKAFLLAKFLERRKIVGFLDAHNKRVPVDNHLVRIALRWGIVRLDEGSMERIRLGTPFRPEEDALLRLAVREAYSVVASKASVDAFILDDYLWLFGRRCCTRTDPTCRSGCRAGCAGLRSCNGGCVFQPVCRAFERPEYMVQEHTFYDTWWY